MAFNGYFQGGFPNQNQSSFVVSNGGGGGGGGNLHMSGGNMTPSPVFATLGNTRSLNSLGVPQPSNFAMPHQPHQPQPQPQFQQQQQQQNLSPSLMSPTSFSMGSPIYVLQVPPSMFTMLAMQSLDGSSPGSPYSIAGLGGSSNNININNNTNTVNNMSSSLSTISVQTTNMSNSVNVGAPSSGAVVGHQFQSSNTSVPSVNMGVTKDDVDSPLARHKFIAVGGNSPRSSYAGEPDPFARSERPREGAARAGLPPPPLRTRQHHSRLLGVRSFIAPDPVGSRIIPGIALTIRIPPLAHPKAPKGRFPQPRA